MEYLDKLCADLSNYKKFTPSELEHKKLKVFNKILESQTDSDIDAKSNNKSSDINVKIYDTLRNIENLLIEQNKILEYSKKN